MMFSKTLLALAFVAQASISFCKGDEFDDDGFEADVAAENKNKNSRNKKIFWVVSGEDQFYFIPTPQGSIQGSRFIQNGLVFGSGATQIFQSMEEGVAAQALPDANEESFFNQGK